MKRLKRAINDLEKTINDYDEKKLKRVNTDTYHRLSESIECTSNYLLNLFGDETKTAVSYKQFRNIVDRKFKNGQEEFRLDGLDNDIIKLLNEFRDMRNWSHHVPQSLLNSQIDYMKNTGIPSGVIDLQFSSEDIIVLEWDYHDIAWLYDLYQGITEQFEEFSKVFQCMKRDYSKLIGNSCRIIKEYQPTPRPSDFKRIGEKSFLINTGKRG